MNEAARVIVITGFMGAGKTSVARALAHRLACEAIDLDELITQREGRTPRAIIEEDGEQSFRQLETRALEEALQHAATTDAQAATHAEALRASAQEATERGAASLVIALGGGAWTIERNRALVSRKHGFVVWLDAPFETCWRRIASEGGEATRPLARVRQQARTLYDERRPLYATASLRVEAGEDKSVETLAREIAEVVSS